MSNSTVPTPERVPFRGTHYVEASAFDSALAHIATLEKKLEGPIAVGIHTQAAEAASEDENLTPEEKVEQAEQEKALEELMHLVGGSLLDDETGPSQILDFVKDLQQQLDTTKEMLMGAEKNFRDLCAWLYGTPIEPCDARIPEVVGNTLGVAKSKIASLEAEKQATATAVKEPGSDTDHTEKGGLPEVTGGDAQAEGEQGTLS